MGKKQKKTRGSLKIFLLFMGALLGLIVVGAYWLDPHPRQHAHQPFAAEVTVALKPVLGTVDALNKDDHHPDALPVLEYEEHHTNAIDPPGLSGGAMETGRAETGSITVDHHDEKVKAMAIRPGRGKPRIAIVIDDVGGDLTGSKRAIHLPSYVTLAFLPYVRHLKEQTKMARDQGHELIVHMPMQPIGPQDPGNNPLRTDLSEDDIRHRVEWALASFTGHDGLNNHMGSRFTLYREGMDVVMKVLKEHGLFFLDSRTHKDSVGAASARAADVPVLTRDVFLDDEITAEAIEKQLERTEHIARQKGYVIAIGHPHPETMDALATWLPKMEKEGIDFVSLHDLLPDQ